MKKLVYGLLTLLIIGVAGTIVSVSASGGFSFDTYSLEDTEVVNGNNIDHIEVDISATDLKVIPTDDSDITVNLTGEISRKYENEIKLDVKEKGDSLKISIAGEDQIKFNIGVLIVDTNLEIRLPEKLYESIRISASSGDIEIADQKAKEITLETNSGSIFADDMVSENDFTMMASSGEIYANNNRAEKFELKANSGDLIVDNQTAKKSTFNTSSGDINLTNALGDLEIEASSGSIMIDNDEVTGHIDARASSGDVDVEFSKEPESLAIRFNGSSGKGEIDYKNVKYKEKSENEIVGEIGSGEYELTVNTNSGDFNLR